MGEVLALALLVDAVAAQFAAEGMTTVVAPLGWREAAKQVNQGPGGANRIVFQPGDESSKFADDLAPRNPGRIPRSIATEREFFTVFVWAFDAAAPESDRAQYTAARLLYDTWRRILYQATHTDGDVGIGPVTIHSQRWNRTKPERTFGAEIVAVCSVSCMVPDEDGYQVVPTPPPLAADVTVTELGQTAALHVEGSP